MPSIPDAVMAPLNPHTKKGPITQGNHEEQGNQEVAPTPQKKRKIIRRGTKRFNGVKMRYVVIAPDPDGAMLESKMIWDDGPKIRRLF